MPVDDEQGQHQHRQHLEMLDQLFSIIPTGEDLRKYYNILCRIKYNTRAKPSIAEDDNKGEIDNKDQWQAQLKREYVNEQPPLSYEQIKPYINNLNTANACLNGYKRRNGGDEKTAWLTLVMKRPGLWEARKALGHVMAM